jgi:hypothetical protein
MTEIGKIDKPDAEKYKNKKKIYFVRNLYLPKNATDKYRDIFNRYWDEVEEHLVKLEIAGKISKIFCESIYMTGEESMRVLKAINERLEGIVKKKIEDGAEFLPLEDKEIFRVYLDWYNCLALVRSTISDRFNHIKSVLLENIADGEAGLLIMRDEDREFLEIPDDIEFFFITPPAYDDLMQFIRDSSSGKEFWRTEGEEE